VKFGDKQKKMKVAGGIPRTLSPCMGFPAFCGFAFGQSCDYSYLRLTVENTDCYVNVDNGDKKNFKKY
jgi:hypothetical protein